MSRLLITMTGVFALVLAVNAAIGVSENVAQAGRKATVADIPLPPQARIQEDGTYRAAQSYRKTVVYFERYLRRQGIAHQRLPTYEVRGVQVTRFLSEETRSRWLAIHVYKIAGVTRVFIVPRAAATTEPPATKAKSASKV